MKGKPSGVLGNPDKGIHTFLGRLKEVARDEAVSITFAELKKGMHARVIGCTACSDEVVRLQEMGLTEGATFEVIKVAPFGDPVEINLRGYRLCLRKNENCAFILECPIHSKVGQAEPVG